LENIGPYFVARAGAILWRVLTPYQEQSRPGLRNPASGIESEYIDGVSKFIELPHGSSKVLTSMRSCQSQYVL